MSDQEKAEIIRKLNKMVANGILTQQEANDEAAKRIAASK